ncbi:CoA pyrophosphatase [Variovorax sp. HJSM1_2]|uniref:CoA pyrophosphatase n=1 Tax=Variovorax sp. HJSM1_2 TaxID=3366263 RepID=UPI003BC9FE88
MNPSDKPLPAASTPLSKLPNFDPRHAPLLGNDAGLPAIALEQLLPSALRARFQAKPVWQPEVWLEKRFADRLPMQAAVLIPIVAHPPEQGGVTVLLTERASHLSTHSGQIAFPGGKVDADDASVIDAAKREAWEEVGLEDGFIEVLGTLPEYVTGTSFHITPVVALVRPGFVLRPNPDEVAAAFEVPLAFLMNPAHHQRHAFDWQTPTGPERREWFSMPYQDGADERFVWGATAGMLRNFYRFLSVPLMLPAGR